MFIESNPLRKQVDVNLGDRQESSSAAALRQLDQLLPKLPKGSHTSKIKGDVAELQGSKYPGPWSFRVVRDFEPHSNKSRVVLQIHGSVSIAYDDGQLHVPLIIWQDRCYSWLPSVEIGDLASSALEQGVIDNNSVVYIANSRLPSLYTTLKNFSSLMAFLDAVSTELQATLPILIKDLNKQMDWAASLGCQVAVERLLELGVDFQRSAIAYACEGGHADLVGTIFADGRLQCGAVILSAVESGNVKVVSQLMRAGAYFDDYVGAYHNCILCIAASLRCADIVQLLLDNLSNITMDQKRIALQTLVHDNQVLSPSYVAVVEVLVSAGTAVTNKIITIAIENSANDDALDYLLSFRERTASMFERSYHPVITAILSRDVYVLQHLLEIGYSPILSDEEGYSPLDYCATQARSDYKDVVSLMTILLETGADVNARTHHGTSVLMETCKARTNAVHVVPMLLQNGADLHYRVQECANVTVLMCFAQKDNVADACPHFVNCGVDLDEVDAYLNSVYHHAASYGEVSMVQFLLTTTANFNTVDVNNQLPITVAAGKKYDEIVKALLTAGSDVDWNSDMFESIRRLLHKDGGCEWYKEVVNPKLQQEKWN